jgi:hypothetical protein
VVFAMALGAAMGDGLPGWTQLAGAALIFASLIAFRPRAAPATIAASAAPPGERETR